MKIIKHGSKYSEDKNSNFSLEAKFESMIKIAKKIINQNKNNTGDCSIETALAYDVANYLPKVLKENEELKADNYELKKETTKYKNMYESEHRIQLLRNEQLDRKQNAITKCNELQKENEKLKEYIAIAPNLDEMTAIKYRNIQQDAYIQGRAEEQKKAGQIIYENYIPKQRVKDIIDRIDYDIKKTKEIILKNTNIYASYRKNDYQIVRLRAMNTKSLDIRKRLQELLD